MEVLVRKSRYDVLLEYSKLTGLSIEELIDRAITTYLQEEVRADMRARAG